MVTGFALVQQEFIGMMIFQIYGGNAPDSVAAFGNGITLVVLGMACGHPCWHYHVERDR